MKLKIEDFGVIKNADIKVDGITVITGNNNTGKSTIGKVFFTCFNSLCDIELKIEDIIIKKHYTEYMEIITDTLLAIPELENISRQFIRLCTRKLSDKFARNKGSKKNNSRCWKSIWCGATKYTNSSTDND